MARRVVTALRTPLTYYGGKQTLAERLVDALPPHDVYLEPFAGGAAVLFAKPRCARETLNDLDRRVMRFWRALRDRPDELAAAIYATPYARDEWNEARADDDDGVDDVEAARRLLVDVDQSFARSRNGWSPPSILRDRRGRWQPGTWANLPEKLLAAAERLRGVALENADAVSLIPRWDVPGAAIYVDPPYTGDHRQRGRRGYAHDDVPDLWPRLSAALLDVKDAAVLLSGYPCDETALLEEAGWERIPVYALRKAAAKARVQAQTAETLWLNPQASESQLTLS